MKWKAKQSKAKQAFPVLLELKFDEFKEENESPDLSLLPSLSPPLSLSTPPRSLSPLPLSDMLESRNGYLEVSLYGQKSRKKV